MADWMREANMPDGSPSPMGYGLDSLTPTDISLAGIAAIVYLQEDENMKESMQYMDVTFMWMAHFLRSRSVTARMLGERASDISWWRVDSAAASTPPPKVLTDDGFQTEAARGMYMATESFRKEASPDDFGLEALTFEAWATELEDTASSGSSVNSSILDQLQSLADRLSRSSSDEIARDVLPGWEYNWSTPNCSASVSALGELAEKTHSRCPFYRSAVPEIATSTNLSNLVSRYYDYLYSVNFSLVESGLRELVPDPKSMGKAARKVVEGVQKRMAKTGNSSMRSEIASSLAIELQTAWSNERGLGSCRRRSEKPQPEGKRLSAASKFVQKELIRRKILVAPYKGEVKKLLDLAVVEAALGAWEDTTQGANTSQSTLAGFVGLLTRCPLIRGWTAQLGRYLLQDKMIMLDSVAEVEDYAKKLPDDVLLAVVFNSADSDGDFPPGALDIDYSIRVHAQLLPPTSRIVKMSRYVTYGVKGMVSYPYLDLGFTYLQEVIGRAAARLEAIRQDVESSSKVGHNIAAGERTAPGRRLRVAVEQFPAPRYAYDGFINVIQYTLPMFMILGWIYAVSLLVREVVYEKQEKLKDVMRIQGLKTWVYWSSWVASAMVQMTMLVTVTTVIMSVGEVVKHSDISVLFVFFWIYSLSIVSFSMFVSSFFSRAKVAAAVAGLAYWVAYMPYSVFNRFEEILTLDQKNAMCLLSPTGMGVGMSLIAKWEFLEEGIQWSNLALPPPITSTGASPSNDHSLASVWFMLLMDIILYQVLAWYIEKVCPGTLGLPQPWYFPLQPSYWRPASTSTEELASLQLGENGGAEQGDNDLLECWEAPSGGVSVPPSVQLKNLSKTFAGGKQALRGISLDLYPGTIVGLLGHNGAGKSTTMAILTGLYPPTGGDVLVHGVSVRSDSIGVRRQLGVCLQHNALYENITVEEHLRLFCCLKSVPQKQVQSEVDALLRDTGLTPKRHAPSRALSGGMKRKLSIGIALAGGSRVVTLDEPTAGVDATSRRDIWHLLVKSKANRTILLSTHFMDEADILSDRIAIIAEGKLTAIASSMALKRHFADGYMLTVVCADDADIGKLGEVVYGAVPNASFAGARGQEFCYVLPFSGRSQFPVLFANLQDQQVRAELKIETYGLSAASMEEVFLKASSVHEKGLHRQVRNGSLDFGSGMAGKSDADSTPVGGDAAAAIVLSRPDDTPWSTTPAAGLPSPFVGPTARCEDPSTPEKGRATFPQVGKDTAKETASEFGATPTVLGMPLNPCDDEQEPPPMSPQCMGDGGSSSDFGQELKELPKKPKATAALHGQGTDFKVYKDQRAQVAPRDDSPKLKTQSLSGPKLWRQQLDALFRKRALSVRRDRKAWASQLLLPAMFVLLALVAARIMEQGEALPPLMLSNDMFIGTTNAGTTNAQNQHVIPLHDTRNDAFSKNVSEALEAGKCANDFLLPVKGGAGSSMAEYLMMQGSSLSSTYGAISIDGEPGPEGKASLTFWFKNQAYHVIPSMVNLWNNARFRLLGFQDAKIKVWSHPLPKTQALLQQEMLGSSQVFRDLTVAITVILAMGFIPASFIVYLVHEKVSNGKHQQLLTGVSPAMYWVSSYLWDIVNYMLPLLVCFLLFIVFEVSSYAGDQLPAMFMLLLCYGLCMTPLMYCLEPVFSVPSTAYVTLICTNIFTGTISTLSVAVLELYQAEIPNLVPVLNFAKAVFPWILPNYCLGRGMLEISVNYYLNFAGQTFGVCLQKGGTCYVDPLSMDVAGKYVFSLLVMAPVWFGVRLLIEWGFFLRGCRKRLAASRATGQHADEDSGIKDEAVLLESRRVAAAEWTATDNLVLHNLEKSFVPGFRCCSRRPSVAVRAVRGVSVGVPAGECFGLLGVNGAGKTTAMRMITGDTDISHGDVLVGGASVQNERDRARRHLGYCPQFDALPEKLTVRETLALYARIRGLPGADIKQSVNVMVSRMCLEAHQNQTCEHLSGGNKRKLSTALALIGEPDVVLLDEPSTGVDVGARRFLWDIIGEIRKSGHAVVLTSHSMEECEVLCTRLTIMVHGQFRCLGSPTQLKAKYGGGYCLSVKALPGQESASKGIADNTACIREFVLAKVPMAILTEVSVGLLRYSLGRGANQGDQDLPLGEIFRAFEDAAAEGGALEGRLSDYSISQTSLEEVFLHFSRESESGLSQVDGAPFILDVDRGGSHEMSSPAPQAFPPSSPPDDEEVIQVEQQAVEMMAAEAAPSSESADLVEL
ncbi:unnamed protein product [Polarella glacialis]|uniref:ABC transporter domain-containing protein n=1 Tax=Polarella glacialis TaxID=89957 RepID=A0A813H6J6_POLGL|nr:unnamed protein product [Polarella glacialis]